MLVASLETTAISHVLQMPLGAHCCEIQFAMGEQWVEPGYR
jgi:hypothetical protein